SCTCGPERPQTAVWPARSGLAIRTTSAPRPEAGPDELRDLLRHLLLDLLPGLANEIIDLFVQHAVDLSRYDVLQGRRDAPVAVAPGDLGLCLSLDRLQQRERLRPDAVRERVADGLAGGLADRCLQQPVDVLRVDPLYELLSQRVGYQGFEVVPVWHAQVVHRRILDGDSHSASAPSHTSSGPKPSSP